MKRQLNTSFSGLWLGLFAVSCMVSVPSFADESNSGGLALFNESAGLRYVSTPSGSIPVVDIAQP